ncbi:class I SAM-dependent methyltransferase [Rhodospirillum centenum]|uniref:Class I SAM-dependent methyltransferase n=1 Tax=Rhodospirillum centenum (strain ATCC 51521 / SW) TaxID=414684 RepID=B6IYI5_RHOCS|nr:methyltransferase domain-containing protein [Rhodospirillum centenum]ACJ01359.1 hypothetical protein RC1_4018 [Rhodospirillum centenum SW]
MPSHPIYAGSFYRSQSGGSLASAQTVVPLVQSFVGARSVVDIGCGVGTWASEFRRSGADVSGMDGPWVPLDQLRIPVESFRDIDLQNPPVPDRRFDLAVCLEVAEHVPETAAGRLISFLCLLSDTVLFSAAIPFQGGNGHVNEQWPLYWDHHFRRNGFECFDILRDRIWSDGTVEYFYRQNLLLFCRNTGPDSVHARLLAAGHAAGAPRNLVHPENDATLGATSLDSFSLKLMLAALPRVAAAALARRFGRHPARI